MPVESGSVWGLREVDELCDCDESVFFAGYVFIDFWDAVLGVRVNESFLSIDDNECFWGVFWGCHVVDCNIVEVAPGLICVLFRVELL